MSDELAYNPDNRLEDALAKLAAGSLLENVLAELGEDAEWLGPMLAITAEVGELKQAIHLPPPEASLQRMLSHAEDLAITISPATPRQPWWQTILSNLVQSERQPALIGRPLLIFFVMGLLLTFLVGGILGGGLAFAAEDSLPGEALYRLKRLGETVRLNLTKDTVQRELLLENFNERRRQEVKRLLERHERVEVAFVGRVEAMTATEITVGTINARITSETELRGQLAVGARVRVEGITQPSDGLLAATITVLEPAPPLPTPTATSTPSPTATVVPVTPTATNTPKLGSASDTIKLTPSPTATSTPTEAVPTGVGDDTASGGSDNDPLAPTATPTPLLVEPPPTTIPTNDDNTNENGEGDVDDNQNDNSGPDNGDDGEDNSGPSGGEDDGDDNSGSGDSNDGDDDDKGDNSGNGGSGSDDDEKSGSSGSGSGKDDDDDN